METNGKHAHGADLKARLRARIYDRREIDLKELGTVEFWVRRLDPVRYMETFGSLFADLSSVDPKAVQAAMASGDMLSVTRHAAEAGRQYKLIDRVILEGAVDEDSDGAPVDAPFFDEELLRSLSIDERAAIATAILEWSGFHKGVQAVADTFPKEAEHAAPTSAPGE
jgi:hypothetical protein